MALTKTTPERSLFLRGERPAQDPVEFKGLLPGQEIGDFRLQRKLGQGGMGQVWQALQISLDRPVALKLMPTDRMPSETQLALFEREAKAGGRLHHPSLVSVLSYGTENGIPYIAQELIGDGWSLADVLRDAQGLGELPANWCRDVAEFFASAAEALAVAHDAGVLHRDLKPENILVGEDTRPVIADFGLASVSGTDSILCTGDLTGTFAYMSPEQALAKRIGIDHRTDVYALGATFYEALTLRRAVEGDSHQQITENIIFADPPTPHSLRSRIPVDLSLVCMKALEKRRRDRYQTMAEFAADLRRWLASETILARPAGPVRRAQRWVSRHRAASLVLGVALLSSAGFAWLSGQLSAKNDELGHSLDRVELLGADLKTALTDARQEKENVLRLSAFQELEDLCAEADSLWPTTPDRLPAYDAWLDRASTLVAGLDPTDKGDGGHRQQLATLRARALPRSEEQRQAERRSHPSFAEWEQKRDEIETAETELETILSQLGDAELPDEQAAVLSLVREGIAAERELLTQLDAVIDHRHQFTFVDANDTWWQNQLVKLISEIEAFANPSTGLFTGLSERWGAGVERRRAFALTVGQRTVSGTEAQGLWADAITSIADAQECPLYEGLIIEPQLGLLPLGRNTDSGLWEFWHVQSGDMPQRSPDGKLQIRAASGLVLVLIPGGDFWMGAQDSEGYQNHDPQAQSDENPVHLVNLSPFFLSKYEMTQGQWLALTGHNPSNFSAGKMWADREVTLQHPVEQVSWEGAMAALPRWGLQHPTEAQWERAARGGTDSPWWTGSHRETLLEPLAANIADQTIAGEVDGWTGNSDWPEFNDGWMTHAPVDSMAPNPYGLHHVHGNVWEWCLDSWGAYFYSRSPSDNPNNQPLVSRNRAFRGGGFNSGISDVRVSQRSSFAPAGRDNNLGLRPARTLSP